MSPPRRRAGFLTRVSLDPTPRHNGALFSNTDAFSSCLRLNAALVWDDARLRALDVIAQECAVR